MRIFLFAKSRPLASCLRFVSEQTSVLLAYICFISAYFVYYVCLYVFMLKVANLALYKALIAVLNCRYSPVPPRPRFEASRPQRSRFSEILIFEIFIFQKFLLPHLFRIPKFFSSKSPPTFSLNLKNPFQMLKSLFSLKSSCFSQIFFFPLHRNS